MNIKNIPESIEFTFPKHACVYLLTDEEGNILYVGKSKNNTIGRIAYHQHEKEFNRVFFINCNGFKEMDKLESKLILKYKPKYNKAIDKKAVGLMSILDIKKLMRIDRRIIIKASHEYGIERIVIGCSDYYGKGIIEAIKKYVGNLKRCPLSVPQELWKEWGKNVNR